jgi:predicted RNase H-like HicB family nuclease
VDEARFNIAEAIELHIEGLLEDGEDIPVEREPIYGTSRISMPVVS